MKDAIVGARNAAIRWVYQKVLKPFYFKRDPEDVHDRMIKVGAFLGRFAVTRWIVRLCFGYSNRSLEQSVLGITFRNPIGLAAGFDKEAELVDTIPSVGFGLIEVGSITGSPSAGNPKPRLWRLPKSQGLVVYYGLKNAGVEAISAKLRGRTFAIPLGTSVAMTNCKENLEIANAVADYAKAFRMTAEIGDYTTVNVSCPNAQGGQPFMDPAKLDLLLGKLDMVKTRKPVFVKLSPDVTRRELDQILDVIGRHRVDGIITTNLTKKRDNPLIEDEDLPAVGGVSGKPVQDLADRLLAYIYRREKDRYVLVGCGGVFTAEDAYRKIRLGANLVQLVTGMIFEGPQAISEINRGLARLLREDGYRNVSEAVGVDNR